MVTEKRLPGEAFALVGDPTDPATWQLPHHRKNILSALKGKLDIEQTVDWQLVAAAVAALSLDASGRRRVAISPEQVLAAAYHLAGHYRQDGKSLPDVLAALV